MVNCLQFKQRLRYTDCSLVVNAQRTRLFPSCVFGTQNTVDNQGGAQQQHSLTNWREILDFHMRNSKSSWQKECSRESSLNWCGCA